MVCFCAIDPARHHGKKNMGKKIKFSARTPGPLAPDMRKSRWMLLWRAAACCCFAALHSDTMAHAMVEGNLPATPAWCLHFWPGRLGPGRKECNGAAFGCAFRRQVLLQQQLSGEGTHAPPPRHRRRHRRHPLARVRRVVVLKQKKHAQHNDSTRCLSVCVCVWCVESRVTVDSGH